DFYLDGAFYGYEQFESNLYCHWQFLSLVLEKLKTVATNDKLKFLKLVEGFGERCSFTLLKIVLRGYNAKPDLYVEEGCELFSKKGILENVTSDESSDYELRALLKNIYSCFSQEQKEKINKLILSVFPKWEKDREKGQPSWVGRTKYRLLKTIPEEELLNYPVIKKQFLELEHKFGNYEEKPPRVSAAGFVGPPLPVTAY
ncbi:unnamed protein product, partial [marine sediment metagenome]